MSSSVESDSTNVATDASANLDANASCKNKQVFVIGAGPSGLASAIHLARRGCAVTLFEAKDSLAQSLEESYPIGINMRGLVALEQLAPEARAAVEASGTISGWTVYSKERTLATLESGVVVQATRGHVVQTILNIAEKTPNLEIRYGYKLVRVDVVAGQLCFSRKSEDDDDEISETIDLTPDARVIDCSGCWSKVRAAMQEADDSFTVETFPWNLAFRCIFTPPKPPIPANVDARGHQIWSTAQIYSSRVLGEDSQWVFCVAAHLDDPAEAWMQSDDASDENVAKLKAYLDEHCPNVAVRMIRGDAPNTADADADAEFRRFFARRTFGGQVVRVSRLHHGERFALLGDSAHSVFPATGEGVNAALEDVGVLLAALDAQTADGAWFAEYDRRRLADARAIAAYAAHLVGSVRAGAAEANVRTATTVATAVARRLGLTGATAAESLFGPASAQRLPYATIVRRWESQQAAFRPIGRAIAFFPNLFAKN